MDYLSINVFDHPSGFTFDPADVLRQVEDSFPGTHVDPGDQLEIRARNAQARWADPSPAMRAVIETMWRDAAQQGPAYAFTIPCKSTGKVQGVVKRHMIQVGFEGQIDEGIVDRVERFLASLIPSSIAIEIERD
jgi:hypothetical protein